MAPMLKKPPAMNVSGFLYFDTIKVIPKKNIDIIYGKGTSLYEIKFSSNNLTVDLFQQYILFPSG